MVPKGFWQLTSIQRATQSLLIGAGMLIKTWSSRGAITVDRLLGTRPRKILMFTIKWGNFEFFDLFQFFALLCVCGACHILMLLGRNWILDFLPFFGPFPCGVIQLTTYFKELPVSVLYDLKNDSIHYDVR